MAGRTFDRERALLPHAYDQRVLEAQALQGSGKIPKMERTSLVDDH